MLTAEEVITKARGKGLTVVNASKAVGSDAAGFEGQVVFNQVKIQGSMGGQGLSLTEAVASGNGVYVPYRQDYCTLGTLSGSEGFFFSDQFGGCDFTILKDAQGNWVGSHVYSSDACRRSIAHPPAGWSVVYTWRSGPYARELGMRGSITVLCFVTKSHLKFVMMHLSGYPPIVSDARLAASVNLSA